MIKATHGLEKVLENLDTIKKHKVPERVQKNWCLIKLVIFSITLDLKELVFVEAKQGKNVMKVNSH